MGVRICIISLFVLLGACQSKPEDKHLDPILYLGAFIEDSTFLSYAKGFKVSRMGKKVLVTIQANESIGFQETRYLIAKEEINQEEVENISVISTPVNSIVCTSTTHIPLLEYLNSLDKLVGFPGTSYISSKKAREFIVEGKIEELGSDMEIDIEKLISLSPDLLMAYTYNGDSEQLNRIEKSGIDVVYNLEFQEPHPLGRAEWIKFVGLLFNQENLADSIFTQIEDSYNQVKMDVKRVQSQPQSVLTGVVYGDTWYLPGGKNHVSIIIQDAGGSYKLAEDMSTGSLQYSFESVFDQFQDADFWLGTGSFTSLKALENEDSRYAKFKPFLTQSVFNYDNQLNEQGGNDYFELGYLRPDIVLKDMASILNQGLYSNYQPYFFRQLPVE